MLSKQGLPLSPTVEHSPDHHCPKVPSIRGIGMASPPSPSETQGLPPSGIGVAPGGDKWVSCQKRTHMGRLTRRGQMPHGRPHKAPQRVECRDLRVLLSVRFAWLGYTQRRIAPLHADWRADQCPLCLYASMPLCPSQSLTPSVLDCAAMSGHMLHAA